MKKRIIQVSALIVLSIVLLYFAFDILHLEKTIGYMVFAIIYGFLIVFLIHKGFLKNGE